MAPTSPQRSDTPRPPKLHYPQTMELDDDADADADDESDPRPANSSPRASRSPSQELPDVPRVSPYASQTPYQDMLAEAARSVGLAPFVPSTIVDPIICSDDARQGSPSYPADDKASASSTAHPAYASSSPPLPRALFAPDEDEDDDSLLDRSQLLARIEILRRELDRAIREKQHLEERRERTLEENHKLATRLSELQQRLEDNRSKPISP
ncbi:hypothetical protein HRG_009680 [Hirsutella rhossiliensis]|uniref:Uncharacterized protein n=1 Tax=Hirsutella rhossiliensis TaxID=111463 RepID=A0A9P8MRM6_9HYPO|nr:uncharacterized protein HRG_09680 [Hirsutella rhossiliensis]KAH0959219.1 hypothetical protein HRG_09680 [Hirsutella rhossiliensis]